MRLQDLQRLAIAGQATLGASRSHPRRSAFVSLELVTIGRVSVDLYAREQGVGFAEVETFAKSVGGSPTNVAAPVVRSTV